MMHIRYNDIMHIIYNNPIMHSRYNDPIMHSRYKSLFSIKMLSKAKMISRSTTEML